MPVEPRSIQATQAARCPRRGEARSFRPEAQWMLEGQEKTEAIPIGVEVLVILGWGYSLPAKEAS